MSNLNTIYFDNAATTKAYPEVAEKMKELLLEMYGNPSSVTKMGLFADKEVRATAKSIANVLHCKEDEIYFTSGGTESDNWAIFGTQKGYARQGNHFITTAIEHAAVSEPMKYITEQGGEIAILPVDEKGYVSLETLADAVREDTVLVSIMHVNNEVGTVQDLQKIGETIKTKNPKTLFHVDAVQGFLKFPIDVVKMKIDLLSMSGHKIHAGKGVGALYVSNRLTKFQPLIYGGGQQKSQRGGTENTPAIAGFGVAVEKNAKTMKERAKAVQTIKTAFVSGVSEIENTKVNGDTVQGSPYIVNVSFPGLRSEVLLHSLEEKGIFTSAGSACNSKKKTASHVLLAMGIDEKEIDATLRFSFVPENTVEEVEQCISVLKEVVPFLRKYNR
ncbi:MAG: cysteine desulfurase family protein [Bacillota bacterium]